MTPFPIPECNIITLILGILSKQFPKVQLSDCIYGLLFQELKALKEEEEKELNVEKERHNFLTWKLEKLVYVSYKQAKQFVELLIQGCNSEGCSRA